jgi:drug/metabolite transporter (DMT)-like permease
MLAAVRVENTAIGAGALGITIVGGSVPVVGLLDGYPVVTGQAIRYGVAGLLLLGWSFLRRVPMPRPGPGELLGLLAVAAVGMIGFNACVLVAQRHADPGFVAAMLGGAPLLLALLAPVLSRSRLVAQVIAGASLVVVGIVVLSGGGSWRGPGLLLALLTLACEVSFTLLAAAVIARLGGFAASTWCCLVAGGLGIVVAAVVDGPGAWRLPTGTEAAALGVLAVLTTAIAFRLWYRAVSILGPDRAGVLIGLMPVSGLVVSVALGAQPLTAVACAGTALVTAGCVLGLRRGRTD